MDSIKIKLTFLSATNRYVAWRKYGKKKNGKLEYMKYFDERVYALGLKTLENKQTI